MTELTLAPVIANLTPTLILPLLRALARVSSMVVRILYQPSESSSSGRPSSVLGAAGSVLSPTCGAVLMKG